MSVKKLNILERINEVRKEVTYIQKDKKQGMRYSIVSHDVVTAKLRPSLVNHGIVYWPVNMDMTQVGNRCQVSGHCRFACIDEPTDCIDVYTAGYGIDDQDKGPGKALSYACKYALLKVFTLETGDDPDLDQHVVLDDPDDVHMQNIKAFETAVEAATEPGDLLIAGSKHAAYMKDAEAKWPAQVQAARSVYSQKSASFKKGSDK